MTDESTIAKRAYEIWEREGRPHGRHDDHWQKAKAELAAPKPVRAAPKVTVAPAKKKAAPAPVAAKAAKPVAVKAAKRK